MLKVQIISEHIHAKYTTIVSASFAIFLGFLVVFYTLYLGNAFPQVALTIAVTILTAGTVYEIYRTRQGFKKGIKRISDMIETIKKDEELPELEELVE